MSKNIGRRAYRSLGVDIVIFLFLLIFAAFMVLPMIFMISSAFKPINELFIFPPKLFPQNPTLSNFNQLSSLFGTSWIPFSRYLANSVFITVVGTVGSLFISSLAAYMLSKHKFPGSKVLFNIVVYSLMFSGGVTAVPSYIIIAKMGMINTYWAVILPMLSSSMGLFLMKQFMDQMVPNTLIEAAYLDGCSEHDVYLKIVMPLIKPAVMTQLIFSFQGIWGTTAGNYILDENLKTLPTAMSNVLSAGIARTGASAAITLILALPPITVFLFSQSNVMQTMSSSGIKE